MAVGRDPEELLSTGPGGESSGPGGPAGRGGGVAREALVVAPRYTADAGLLAGLGIEAVVQVLHGAVRAPASPRTRPA